MRLFRVKYYIVMLTIRVNIASTLIHDFHHCVDRSSPADGDAVCIRERWHFCYRCVATRTRQVGYCDSTVRQSLRLSVHRWSAKTVRYSALVTIMT